MRVLVTTPLLSVLPRGACEHDRVAGIQQLVRLGHDVRVFSFLAPWQKAGIERKVASYVGCPVEVVDYQPMPATSLEAVGRRLAAVLRRPGLLDGAALVYTRSEVVRRFDDVLRTWQPEVCWFDYTNLWPLLERGRRAGLATVMRSINYEPQHNLDERGRTLANHARYVGKYLGERASIRCADAFAAITPADRREYLRLGRSDCAVLPLRSLARLLRPARIPRQRTPLELFFFGSTYAVSHNRAALRFIVDEILPAVRRVAPGRFRFNLLGAKAPAELTGLQAEDLRLHGFVPDLDAFLEDMDAAVIPSLHGGGMQQKIFEPLCRGFPAILSSRGLAAFPVRDDEHALLASTADEFVAALLRLRDPGLRARLSAGASAFAIQHFNAETLDATVRTLLASAADRRSMRASA